MCKMTPRMALLDVELRPAGIVPQGIIEWSSDAARLVFCLA